MALPPPRKRLGQHFLSDAAKIEEVAAAVGIADTLIEIGPGRGALTFALVPRTRNLIAIEKDPVLAEYLKRRFADNPVIEIRHADALREDLSQYPTGARLVGNLPYNVATAMLRRWLDPRIRLADLTVMVQREVALRLAAPPGDPSRGQLSVAVQLSMRVEPLFDVAPECFDPPPKVVSTVVRLAPRKTLLVKEDAREDFLRLVQQAFASRRKTLRNNLPEIPDLAWARAEIDPRRRAETLSCEEFARLFQTVRSVQVSGDAEA